MEPEGTNRPVRTYRELLERLVSCVVVVDACGSIQRHTGPLRTLMGGGGALTGQAFSALFSADQRAVIDDLLRGAAETGSATVRDGLLRNGRSLTMVAVSLIEPGESPAVCVTLIDEMEAVMHVQSIIGSDPWTGVLGRGALEATLRSLDPGRIGAQAVLAVTDLDSFKAINDTHGHAAGDTALRLTAERLVTAVGSAGTVFRLGGDEFAVLFPDATLAEAIPLLALASQAVALPITVDGAKLQVSISVGVAASEMAGSWQGLLGRADRAMYLAKATTRGSIYVYQEQGDHADMAQQTAQERLVAAQRRVDGLRSDVVRLRELNRLDARTGLLNYVAFENDLTAVHEMSRRRADAFYSLVLCDIDFFREFNARYLLQRGNSALRRVAQTLQRTCRPGDHAYRYGGEEFMVVLPQTRLEDAATVAERMRAAVEELAVPHESRPSPPPIVTISIGVTHYRLESQAAMSDVVDTVNRALRVAKESGRNRVELIPLEGRVSPAGPPRPG